MLKSQTVYCPSKGLMMQGDGVGGYLLQADTAYTAGRPSEIGIGKCGRKADCLKQLGASLAADRADSHLAQELEQSFAKRFDVVLACHFVVELYFLPVHQILEDGERHIWVDGACSVA